MGSSLLPFIAMVVVMAAQVSYMEITKLALSQGKNKYVIIVYAQALSALLLLPCSIIVDRSNTAPLTLSVFHNIFWLSVFGSCSCIFSFAGLQYASPTLGTAMLNLIPAFTFILALSFRLEKVKWRSKSSNAKCIGTIVSIAGAFVVTFYKGPTILGSPILHTPEPHHRQLQSTGILWIIGALFLACQALCDSSLYILEAIVLKKFPAVITVICYHFFFEFIITGIFALFVVEDSSAWKLELDIGLVAVIYAGVLGLGYRTSLVAWCVHKAGPLFVATFKPLAIVLAVIMDAILLRQGLSLGSFIGGIIIVTGVYTVLWGKSKEKKATEKNEVESSKSSSNKVPLLENRVEEI